MSEKIVKNKSCYTLNDECTHSLKNCVFENMIVCKSKCVIIITQPFKHLI